MPRSLTAAVLLAALVLLPPGTALAGPPEGASGKMVLDEVADGLRKYRNATEPQSRLRWLGKLALTRDPRVAILLHNVTNDAAETERMQIEATFLLARHFIYGTRFDQNGVVQTRAWWIANKADLRRRAAQLPR
jgi:hypothetical protein